MSRVAPDPLTVPDQFPLQKPAAALLKRCFDVTFSLLVVASVWWWLHLLLALAVRLGSRGPVFFRQRRIGYRGQVFTCLKYRTMHWAGLPGIEEPVLSSADARVTPVGRFLRRSNLDELPQFLNVLKGDMSVVGPRPHMVSEDAELRRDIPGYEGRLLVLPGITGWAAVNGYRGGTRDMAHMRRRIELDLWYIAHWSIWLDLRICLTTAWQMLNGRARGK